jgi:hypothetical protein
MKKLFGFALISLLLWVSASVSAADFWPAHCIKPLAIGQTINGTLATSSGCYDYESGTDRWYDDVYTFTGTAGQKVAITMNGVGGFDPYFALYLGNTDALANWIAADDDGGGGVNARMPAGTGYITLPSTGTYFIWASTYAANTGGRYTLTLSSESASAVAEVLEYYHSGLDHYFMTANQAEAAGLDANSALGWLRTGNTFKSGGSTPVCRFYGSMSPGPNSHFYTLAGAECDSLKQLQASTPATEKRWNFENLDFSSTPTTLGVCESGTVPVYRAYNNGYARGLDSNHRVTRNLSAIWEVADRGWLSEGMVMCAPPSTNKGITGDTFTDASGAAAVSIAQGTIPAYVNASAPTMTAVSQLPSKLVIDTLNGDVNITQGGLGYGFDLTGDRGFYTTATGAVKISLPFNAAGIPSVDLGSPLKIFLRVFDPDDNSFSDLNGNLTSTGSTYKITVESRGLPNKFTAVVIYNAGMDAVSTDDVLPTDAMSFPTWTETRALGGQTKTASTTWVSSLWCTIYNANHPKLVNAVKSLRHLTSNPSKDEIKSTISYKVSQGARKAQLIYQKDGFIGPNLYTGLLTSWKDGTATRSGGCGGNTPMYFVHMTDNPLGSHYSPADADETDVRQDDKRYGRLYIGYDRVDDIVETVLGSVQASIAHEMHHAIQNSYELLGNTPRGYREGSATVYGKTLDNNEVITVRDEIKELDDALMHPSQDKYANEDFFAYVARQYNDGSLGYLSGLYTKIRSDIGSGVINPAISSLHGATDAYFKSAFSLPLKDIYLDFVKQRSLEHNAASQFGRTGEITRGFAEKLFNKPYVKFFPVPVCNDKASATLSDLAPLSSRYLRIKPMSSTGHDNGPTVVVKVTPSFGALGGAWSGFSYRDNAIDTIKTSNTYPSFGEKAGDEIVMVIVNLDLAQTGSVNFDLTCTTLKISALAPAKGPVDTTVTISGSGFGTGTDTRAVYFNGIKAPSVTWISDTQISAKVPQNATTGDVVVEVNGVKSNALLFTVDAVIIVAVSPTTASISTGATQAFTATVSGSANKGVTWSATGGTISSAGLYTAPTAAGTYTVTATSVADTNKKASATITVSSAATAWGGTTTGVVNDNPYHISYTITGPTTLVPKPPARDHFFLAMNNQNGNLSRGGTLTFTAKAWIDATPGEHWIDPENPAHVNASIKVDDKIVKEFYYKASGNNEMLNQSVTLSVQIPQNANSAKIEMSIFQNWGGGIQRDPVVVVELVYSK